MSAGTLGDRFGRTATHLGPRIAVREPERDWSYAELLRVAQGVSRALGALGAGPGARVGLMASNSAAFVAGFHGIVGTGGVVAPLNVRYRDQELVCYLNDTGKILRQKL